MAIERQEVQGIQRVQSTGIPRSSQTSTIQVGTPQASRESGSFFSDIVNAVGSVAKVGTAIMNQAVEDDKVRQYDRAMNGLLPSDDATRGGTRAHMLVKLQNDVMIQTFDLTEAAKRFEGTDEEWESLVVSSRNEVQAGLWSKYPELIDDLDTMRMVTNSFMEQQPKVFAARANAKLEREAAERTSSMRSRIITLTDGLSGKPLDAALAQLQQEAIALQLTKPEFETLVAEIATERAAIGDGVLVDGTKSLKDNQGVSLYQRNGKLMSAEISANRAWAAQNQVALFEKKDAAIQAFEAGALNRKELLQIMDNQNRATGGTAWSDSEIQSLFNKQAKSAGEAARLQDLMARAEGGSPLGLQDISSKERSDYAEALQGFTQKLADDEIAKSGATGEEAEAIRGKYERIRYIKLGEQLIKDPNIKHRYDSLMQMSSANLKDMNVEPEALQTIMMARDAIPEDARRAVMGDEEYAFVDNFDLATQMGMNTGQSIEFAQRAARSTSLGGSVLKELNKTVDGVVDDVASGSFFSIGDSMGDVGRDLMTQDASVIARSMKVAGMSNDSIKRNLEATLKTRYSQMKEEGLFSDGVLVQGDTRGLGKVIGANGKDIGTSMRQYISNNKQDLLDNASGFEEKDLYYDVDMKRGLFTIRAGSARVPVTPAMPLSEIKAQDLLQQRLKEAKDTRDKDLSEFKERQEEQWGGFIESQRKMSAKDIGSKGIDAFLVSEDFLNGGNLPNNYEFGFARNNEEFLDYVAKTENGNGVGYDKLAGTYTPYKDAHGQSVGFGHFITPTEKANGYIEIGDLKVPFEEGTSQLTQERAKDLLEQDMAKHVPSTSDWKESFSDIKPSVQRGIMDLTYNLGKGGIKGKAKTEFENGNYADGFIEMLSTASSEGKRMPALLARRANAYNIAMGGELPKITEMDVREDGSMYVKFDGKLPSDIKASFGVDQGGWFKVYGAKEDSLYKGSKTGKFNIK